jgi:hypothetical protein
MKEIIGEDGKKYITSEIDWETIYYHDEDDTDGSTITSEYTMRAPIPGGWLVRHTIQTYGVDGQPENYSQCMTFVPAPSCYEHEEDIH